MDSWPKDVRNNSRDTENTKGKESNAGKDQTAHTLRDFPCLEEGSLSAITLREVGTGGRLEWNPLLRTSQGERLALTRGPTKIFPDTRPPPLSIPKTSVVQRAEQGANFLRTYLPDVDVSAELIREEIEGDTKLLRKRESFDPHLGNLLACVRCDTGPQRKEMTYLAFPIGDTSRSLNISPFLRSPYKTAVLTPSSLASVTFDTPICQIVAAAPSISNAQDFHLAVRTQASTSILRINAKAKHDPSRPVSAIECARIPPGAAGGVAIADVEIDSEAKGAFFVNNHGGLYKWTRRVADLFIRPMLRPSMQDIDQLAGDCFWKLAHVRDNQACLLASEKVVELLDFRTNAAAQVVYCSSNHGQVVTHVERETADNLIRVATTSEIVWIDGRSAKRPLIAYKHGRRFDRSLQTHTVHLKRPLTFLTSTKNGMVTVYDVSRADDGMVHSNMEPYCLPPITTYGSAHAGYVFLQQAEAPAAEVSLLQMGPRGNIHRADFIQGPGDVSHTEMYEWSPGVQDLDKQAVSQRPDPGPLGRTDATEVDLNPAYRKIFGMASDNTLENDSESVYETLDRMPSIWQHSDVPLEHMITVYDVAFRSGNEPKHPSRADFLTTSTLNSTRGYRALVQGRIPVDDLTRQVSWSRNIGNTLNRISGQPIGEPHAVVDSLRAYDLASHSEASGSVLRIESHAREQLSLDLALSTDVLSTQPFSMPSKSDSDNLETMSMAAEAMSLDDVPPPVHFGYLRPVPKGAKDHYNRSLGDAPDDAPSEELESPLGVRLLLKEWEVGVDPEDFEYTDPYDNSVPHVIPERQQRRKKPTTDEDSTQQIDPTQSQCPPLVIAARAAQSSRTLAFGSQPTMADIPPSSQDIMTNTQIWAGPHGGRQATAKKKPAKKRVGRNTHAPAYLARDLRLNGDSDCRPASALYGWAKVIFLILAFFVSGASNPWFDGDAYNRVLKNNKAVVCALSASYISTFAGYPLDSLKSRLQTTKTRISIPRLASLVYREEGIIGFYRGLWIPLITISFVRAASFTIYTSTKDTLREKNYLNRNRLFDVAAAGGIGGALSGALISFGSAPFELVKVRRQLEYTIAASKGLHLRRPPGTLDAVRDIFRTNGIFGLYTGFRLHFFRDTSGTALYFLEYDGMRHLLGRMRSGEQGQTPSWLPIHHSLIPFVCGSLAGVSSWALIYPVDVVKTKVQQRALSGEAPRGVWETLQRLVRGPDPRDPKPILAGVTRIYRGLGVSALRSITTHGLLWTLFDTVGNYIDRLPPAEKKYV
ncbi:hypothetical protein PLICRDRAFT_110552 [Plicaturopsis crispa FD-325 SS-3]|nr:hypothetical protein PLICRDRAFT_110552 [Plicaturopsis crispa FD-325 SS-3]